MLKEADVKRILDRSNANYRGTYLSLEAINGLTRQIYDLTNRAVELPLLTDEEMANTIHPPAPVPGLSRPKIVCLCGSTRFYEAFQKANLELTVGGIIVLSIGCNLRSDTEIFSQYDASELHALKVRLDELHKRKIDLCDSILVLNVGGYIGDSTRSEIEYAKAHGKPVEYLETILQQSQKENKP